MSNVVQLSLFEEERDFRLTKKYREGIFKTKEQIVRDLKEQGRNNIVHVLSFGGGSQSSVLLEKHFQGELYYDYIIFADTGAEPGFIHEQVQWWRDRQKLYGNRTPFITTHHKSMVRGLEEMLMRYIHTDYQRFQMPVYCSVLDERTGEERAAGIMPRQCTVDFKIVPVQQAARQLVLKSLGLSSRQRMPSDIGFVIDIGFSYDEIRRINTYQSSQFKYMYLAYPLVEDHLTTEESIDYLKQHQLPTKRSRCYLCPFNCDRQGIGMDWKEIIEEEPLSFLKACYFDEELRRVQCTGSKVMKSIPYLHYSRRPLRDVYASDYASLVHRYCNEFEDWLREWEQELIRSYSAASFEAAHFWKRAS